MQGRTLSKNPSRAALSVSQPTSGLNFKAVDLDANALMSSQIINSKKRYLPIDAYDPLLDEEDPNQLIENYKDPETGCTLAKSKWFLAASHIVETGEKDNHYEMRQC